MISVQLTNGFGNNLFQYNAAKLLAEYLEQQVCVMPPYPNYYATPYLRELGMIFGSQDRTEVVVLDDRNYRSAFDKKYANLNFVLRGYFEDYTIFETSIERIKTWYPKIKKREDKDLAIHLRTGDRLFYKNEFYTKPSVDSYLSAIEKFDFENLHIVTDMPTWKYLTEEELSEMKFHRKVPKEESVSLTESVKYFNSLVEGLSIYDPQMTNRTIIEDFNFIRTFDNILFQHGTLGWWASVLSEASSVGVYGPWRQWKGPSNKNLSKIKLPGWFQWE